MTSPILLGVDPGLAHFGVALVALEGAGERIVHVETIATAPSASKRRVLQADDNVRRCRELCARLLHLVGQHHPKAICAESMSHPRAAGSAAKLAMSWGAVSFVAELLALPLVQASPQAIKRALTGEASASKVDVQAALVARYGPIPWPKRAGDVEHAADALAAVVACLGSDVVMMARRLAA